jgi:hypothetical protein
MQQRTGICMRSDLVFRLFSTVALILVSTQTQAGEADIFVSDYNNRVKAIALELGIASVNFSMSLALGDCETKDQKKFDETLQKFDRLRSDANIAISKKFDGGDPESVMVQKIVLSTHARVPELVSHFKVGQAKAALDSKKCDEIADRLYRDVVDLDADPTDVRKAMLGVEDLRERRRSGIGKSFSDRWWNGK